MGGQQLHPGLRVRRASAGRLADVLGRKKVLIGTAILFAVSAVGAGWAGTFNWLIVFRLLGGLAIGPASGVAPVYVAETAPPGSAAVSCPSTNWPS